METWDAIDSIRVVRRFSADPIGHAELGRILNAGRRAGSSKNLQRWTFIVIHDRARLDRLSKVGDWAGHLAEATVAIALVTPDPRAPDAPLSIAFDLGRAAQNMVLAAWELGIGSVPATVYDHDATRAILGYPADHHCEYLLSFGYPADRSVLTAPKQRGGRASLRKVVRHETWEGN